MSEKCETQIISYTQMVTYFLDNYNIFLAFSSNLFKEVLCFIRKCCDTLDNCSPNTLLIAQSERANSHSFLIVSN